jgi:hypothetical protein
MISIGNHQAGQVYIASKRKLSVGDKWLFATVTGHRCAHRPEDMPFWRMERQWGVLNPPVSEPHESGRS